jgi:hypothetical protein
VRAAWGITVLPVALDAWADASFTLQAGRCEGFADWNQRWYDYTGLTRAQTEGSDVVPVPLRSPVAQSAR